MSEIKNEETVQEVEATVVDTPAEEVVAETIEETKPEKEKDKNTKWKVAIAIMVIIIIILLLSFKSCSDQYQANIFDDPVPMAEDEDYQKMLDNAVAESMMNVNYLPYATMQSDGIHSETFQVNNSPNNHDALKFYIYNENGDMVYESADIPTGYQVNSVTLRQALPKGENKCTIELHYASSGNVSSKFPINITVP